MKEPKIVITDNRQVYWIKLCWLEERHPSELLHRLDQLQKSIVKFSNSMRYFSRVGIKVSESFNEFHKQMKQEPDYEK